ncbi:MAG TPA: Rne/Rng family ribonuclease [Candidatus Cybelea sp.]|nr:Rne/Rng family ribonuclease [Candidatus Cybelea sp.]
MANPNMPNELLIDVGLTETRIAVVEDGRVVGIDIDRRRQKSLIGSIWLGRVTRIMAGMQAAFVDIGLDRAGFLAARDARVLGPAGREAPAMAQLVHEGQAVLVQVAKDAHGDKGVRLTADISLPGRNLVYAPLGSGVFVSRRIEDGAERARLAEALANLDGAPGGFILRTAAAGATADAIRAEAAELAKAWSALSDAAGKAKPPACLKLDLDPVERALRDHLTPAVERVRVNSAAGLARARAYAENAMRDLAGRIELHRGPAPIFALYGIEDDLAQAAGRRVPLPSGGAIAIDATQALTAIDVDSGSFVAGRNIEDTALRTNLEAAAEIARQLRLRGIGGIVVIDFIHLDEPAHREQLQETLKSALARDRAPIRVSNLSEFGLVELTRKRTGEPLLHLLTESCGVCAGEGRAAAADAIAAEVVRRAQAEAATAPGLPLTLVVAGDIAEALERDDCVAALAEATGVAVTLRRDAAYRRNQFDVVAGAPP